MAVPFIDLSRLVQRVRANVLPAWEACLDASEFVGGPRVAALESKLASVLGVPHAVTCANGTDALILGLQALGVKQGSKVAIPNLTFWATYEAVAQLGATPVLIDVDPEDLQMSLTELRSAHDAHRFDHAVLVHLYGWASKDLHAIRAFCKERGVALLEDGAQSIGVEVDGEPIASSALASTLSFYPAKVVGGAMDGGALLVPSVAHDSLLRALRNHGRSDHYAYAHVGWSSRMGSIQASFLDAMVDLLPEIVADRRASAAWYRDRLRDVPGVKVYGPPNGVTENGYLNVVTVPHAQRTVDALTRAGIGSARTYPSTMDAQPPAANAIRHGDLRHSRSICEHVVNLPLFYGIREEEREASVRAFVAAISE